MKKLVSKWNANEDKKWMGAQVKLKIIKTAVLGAVMWESGRAAEI